MPVSKKRLKDGKPVHRKVVAPPTDEAKPEGPQPGAASTSSRPLAGRPSNPFIAQQRKSSQRGR